MVISDTVELKSAERIVPLSHEEHVRYVEDLGEHILERVPGLRLPTSPVRLAKLLPVIGHTVGLNYDQQGEITGLYSMILDTQKQQQVFTAFNGKGFLVTGDPDSAREAIEGVAPEALYTLDDEWDRVRAVALILNTGYYFEASGREDLLDAMIDSLDVDFVSSVQ